MNDHQIIRELLKHVIFRMMGVVTLICITAVILIASYALADANAWILLWVFAPVIFFFIIFHFQWRNPARVHKLIELLPKEVQDHIDKNFEIVCLEGNMNRYVFGVWLYERNLHTSYEDHTKVYFKDQGHKDQSYWLGIYLRSITKWA